MEPIVVTDTEELRLMFAADIYANTLGITERHAERLAGRLVEILRAACPTPPNLVDALGGEWFWIAGYSDGDGNMRDREAIESDPELYPVTEVED